MLARLGRFEQAEPHFKAAYNMDKGKTPDIIMAYAEVIIALNKGTITPQANRLITTSLQKDAINPKGLFFKGLFFAQNNNTKQAIEIWKNLVIQSEGKPYYAMLVQNLNAVRQQFNINPATIGLDTTQDIRQDNLPMIEKMVQSLADKVKQNPNDEKLKARLKEVQEKLKTIKTF
jgi:cytochrome c-type biogenesis protein CcmH/NrfG